MILSRLDIYSCRMIAEEQKIMSVSEMMGWTQVLKEHSSVLTSAHNTGTILSVFLKPDGEIDTG